MSKAMKPSVALTKALSLLGNGGKHWIKGASKLDVGAKARIKGKQVVLKQPAFCSIGALDEATNGNWDARYSAESFLMSAASKLTKRATGVISFNDSPRRTWPQIRKMFTMAIAAAKKVNK